MKTLPAVLATVAPLCLAAFIPASASAAAYELRLYQVDDLMTASITNSLYTDQTILTQHFGQSDYPYFDISPFVTDGLNTITLQLTNTSPGQGWTYGYDLKIDGTSIASDSCGNYNTFGCNNNDTTQGVVFTKAISFSAPVPEPASWTMMIGGFGMIGSSLRRRKAAFRYA